MVVSVRAFPSSLCEIVAETPVAVVVRVEELVNAWQVLATRVFVKQLKTETKYRIAGITTYIP